MGALFAASATAKIGAPEVLAEQLGIWYGLAPAACRWGTGAVVALESGVVALGMFVMRPTEWLVLVAVLVGAATLEASRLNWIGLGAASCGCGLPGNATVAASAVRNSVLLLLSLSGLLAARRVNWRLPQRRGYGMVLVMATAVGAALASVGRSPAPVEVDAVLSLRAGAAGLRLASVELTSSTGEPLDVVDVEPSCECLRAWSVPEIGPGSGMVRIYVAEESRDVPGSSSASIRVRGRVGAREFRTSVPLW